MVRIPATVAELLLNLTPWADEIEIQGRKPGG
mgnify:CR=1 FL=1